MSSPSTRLSGAVGPGPRIGSDANAAWNGHDEATLKQISHHVVGEVVTPEIQAAADWMDSLQAVQQAAGPVPGAQADQAGASVTPILGRTAAS